MILSKPVLILLLHLTAISLTFILPKGVVNRIYQVYYNDASKEIYELIRLNPFENETASSLLVLNTTP